MDAVLGDSVPGLDAAALAALRRRKRGGKKHKGPFRRVLAVPDLILEFHVPEMRENALRSLSGMLNDRREDDSYLYYMCGPMLCQSPSAVQILVQELVAVYPSLAQGDVNIRSSKRVGNILTLLQTISHNHDTRRIFTGRIAKFVLPFIMTTAVQGNAEVCESLRLMALCVIAVLCEDPEWYVVEWLMEAKMARICFHAISVGTIYSKVLAVHILELMAATPRTMVDMAKETSDTLSQILSLLVGVAREAKSGSKAVAGLLTHSLKLAANLCQSRRACELLTAQLLPHIEPASFIEPFKRIEAVKTAHASLLLKLTKKPHAPIQLYRPPLRRLQTNSSSAST